MRIYTDRQYKSLVKSIIGATDVAAAKKILSKIGISDPSDDVQVGDRVRLTHRYCLEPCARHKEYLPVGVWGTIDSLGSDGDGQSVWKTYGVKVDGITYVKGENDVLQEGMFVRAEDYYEE